MSRISASATHGKRITLRRLPRLVRLFSWRQRPAAAGVSARNGFGPGTEHYSLGGLIARPTAGLIAAQTNPGRKQTESQAELALFLFMTAPAGVGPRWRGANLTPAICMVDEDTLRHAQILQCSELPRKNMQWAIWRQRGLCKWLGKGSAIYFDVSNKPA